MAVAVFFYISIPVIFAESIIATYFTAILCYRLSNYDANMKMSKVFRISQIICSIGCTLNIYSDLSRFVAAIAINTNDLWHDPLTPVYSHADALYYLGAISFYIIAVLRLHKVFVSTAYEINKYYLSFICILIFISIGTAIYYCLIVAILLNGGQEKVMRNFFKYDGPAIIILMVIDFMLNSNLMILFVYKLRQVLVSTQYTASSMTDVMTRHTILFGIAIGTNQLFFISLVVGLFAGTLKWWIYILRSSENLTNVVVLYLSLSINRRVYMKVCGKLHSAMKVCCVHQITQKENKDNDHELAAMIELK